MQYGAVESRIPIQIDPAGQYPAAVLGLELTRHPRQRIEALPALAVTESVHLPTGARGLGDPLLAERGVYTSPPSARTDQLGQAWAKCLIDLLVAACYQVATVGAPLPAERIAHYRAAYDRILTNGETANSSAPPSGNHGRTKQSKALNLMNRFRLHADDVWRFMIDPGVPFTNKLGEQAVRMPNVKQKASGGFRTAGGIETFCAIRSYLATLNKQGKNLYLALTLTFQSFPAQPRFE